jgi:WD40 repeat protein
VPTGISQRPTVPVSVNGSAAAELPSLAGYEVLERLGHGGMGVVYKARQTKLNRLVALKMIRDGVLATPDQRARFQTEARAVAKVQHPHIVQIYEIGEQHGLPYFALELVEGGNLAQKLAVLPLPLDQAVELVETLARAMHHAHQQGIVHRDLKPANILLQIADCRLQNERRTEEGPSPQSAICNLQSAIPKITDFGLAKELEAEVFLTHTQSGTLMGTPSYMAPEQAWGKNRTIGPAADIYALGAILYETVTGRPPFLAAKLMEVLEQVRSQEPAPPRQLRPDCPRDLETICLKCLHKDPVRRYATAADLADDLRRYRGGETIHARRAGRLEKGVKWVRRRPAAAALVGVLLAAGVLAALGVEHARRLVDEKAGVAAREKSEREEAEDQARKERYPADLERANQALGQGNKDLARQVLDQCHPDRRGWEWHYLSGVCDRCRTPTFQAHGQRVAGLAFSAAAPELASAGSDFPSDTVRLWDPVTIRETLRLPVLHGRVSGLARSPDGTLLAVAVFEERLIMPKDGENDKKVPQKEKEKTQAPFEVRDERAFVAVAWPADEEKIGPPQKQQEQVRLARGEVVVWDVWTRKALFTIPTPGLPAGAVAFSPDGQTLALGLGLPAPTMSRVPEAMPAPREGPDKKGDAKKVQEADRVRSAGRWGPALVLAGPADGAWLALAEPPVGRGDRPAPRPLVDDPGRVVLWDVARRKEVGRVDTDAAVAGVAFHPGGRHLAAACADGSVRLWEVEGGRFRPVHTLNGHEGRVTALCYDRTGTVLASAGEDGTVRIWDTAAGRERFTLRDHLAPAVCVAFHPDGKRLASAGFDKTVKVYDTATGRLLLTLRHRGFVTGLVFSSDGRSLASATADGAVTLWGGDAEVPPALRPPSDLLPPTKEKTKSDQEGAKKGG